MSEYGRERNKIKVLCNLIWLIVLNSLRHLYQLNSVQCAFAELQQKNRTPWRRTNQKAINHTKSKNANWVLKKVFSFLCNFKRELHFLHSLSPIHKASSHLWKNSILEGIWSTHLALVSVCALFVTLWPAKLLQWFIFCCFILFHNFLLLESDWKI